MASFPAINQGFEMLLYIVLLFSLVIAATNAGCGWGRTCIEVLNKCPFPVWPGVQGKPGTEIIEAGGFHLPAGQSKTISVPDGWEAGRIWARTGCDGTFKCATGFCGVNRLQCEGRGPVPPVSLAEFTLTGARPGVIQDIYAVSLVNGYNLPVLIDVGTFDSHGGERDCKRAGGCFKDLDHNRNCPLELRKIVRRKTVGCKSACAAFDTDQYCCRGHYHHPETCLPSEWPRNYAAIFKDACFKAYSYAYDDESSSFVCRGKSTPSPTYRVQFC